MHPQALIQRRELIPHRAAAIQLRLAPTPHPAAAIAVAAVVGVEAVALAVEAELAVALAVEAEVAVAVVAAEVLTVAGAEALTAVEVPAHTVTVKSLWLTQRPARKSRRASCFSASALNENCSSLIACSFQPFAA